MRVRAVVLSYNPRVVNRRSPVAHILNIYPVMVIRRMIPPDGTTYTSVRIYHEYVYQVCKSVIFQYVRYNISGIYQV